MAYVNVNTGTAAIGASGAAISPTCTAATAGNLLVIPAVGGGTINSPAAPAGWTRQTPKAGNSGCSACIMWKIAAGGETGATLALVASTTLAAQILEFSGNASGTPTDQTGNASGATSPSLATFAGTDLLSGELIVCATVSKHSANATEAITTTLTTVASTTSADNHATATVSMHYQFSWGITTSNGSADTASFAFPTTNITGSAVSAWSFKLSATTASLSPVLQHIRRASAQQIRAYGGTF